MELPVPRERVMVAAMVDPVEEGQQFAKIPPHMTVRRWLNIYDDRHLERLTQATERIFRQDYFQNTIGGRHSQFGERFDEPVREMKQVERGPWYALTALAKSLSMLPEDDPFKEVFNPHVTDTQEYQVRRGQRLAFSAIALISRGIDDTPPRIKEVKAAFPLGMYRPDEDAA
jgi:hypothetical protein